jgi:hypothetical protein
MEYKNILLKEDSYLRLNKVRLTQLENTRKVGQ